MFALGERVVYPGHGVAQISKMFERSIAGSSTLYYELTFLNKDVTILVPTNNAETVGIRPLTSEENISAVFKILNQPIKKISNYEFTASNWNKRNKEYQLKLRTGSLKALLEIYRDLRTIETHKELSFGEKNLLQQTEGLLVEEISLVQKLAYDKAVEQLRSLCVQKIAQI
jgi:CarD family transcriptional regulator